VRGRPTIPSLLYMSSIATTVFLLVCSNVFMTFAWYGHLKNLRGQPLVLAIGVSW
jgi:uncharacterized protein (DUF486 family)